MGGQINLSTKVPKVAQKKVSSMSSNGPLRNYCGVPDKYLIGHVLRGQN